MNYLNRKHSYFIGIDPGRHTGVAVWHKPSKTFTLLKEMKFWEVVEFLRLQDPATTTIVIEDPNLNKPVFAKAGVTIYEVRKRLKTAQDVGRNKEHAALLITLCQNLGLTVTPIRPSTAKLNAQAFARYTGVKERLNEHIRDAAMKVFNL